ncbi:MAG: JAB domain-containing protein [Sphingomonas bacterium]
MIAPNLLHLFAPIARTGNEIAIFAYLDSAGRLLGARHVLSERIDAIHVPIRAVAGDALAFGAEQVVMAHNHPSGDAEPSRDDLLATRRVAAALNTLEIRLVDHLVLAGDRVTSLRGRGLL